MIAKLFKISTRMLISWCSGETCDFHAGMKALYAPFLMQWDDKVSRLSFVPPKHAFLGVVDKPNTPKQPLCRDDAEILLKLYQNFINSHTYRGLK